MLLQSFLARKSLNIQLQRVGAFSSIDCISMFGEDFETFKTCMNFMLKYLCLSAARGSPLSFSVISPELNIVLLLVWVEQGDEISLEYAGTHALKRDLVRYLE